MNAVNQRFPGSRSQTGGWYTESFGMGRSLDAEERKALVGAYRQNCSAT